jgi:nitroreductase
MPNLEELKHAPTELGIHDLIASRWSPRAYSDKHVSADDLTKIFTAASWAASSANEQPWRFLFGRKGDETFAKIFDSLAVGNQGWVQNVPVLLLSVAKANLSPGPYGGGANYYALHDTGAASATLSLQATALGMHTHGMGGFDKDKARAHFAIPDDFEIGAVWALGYLGDAESLPEPLKARELAGRTRKAMGEFVFREWDVAAEF